MEHRSLVLALLFTLIVLPRATLEAPSLLDDDDECLANAGQPPAGGGAGGGGCALSALQLRAKARIQTEAAAHETENHTAAGAADVTWYLASVGESCTQACSAKDLVCSAGEFSVAATPQKVSALAERAGAKCSTSWANDREHGNSFTAAVPAVCQQTQCGSDPLGTCAYDALPRSTCEGLPPAEFQRLCPCGAASSTSRGSAIEPSPSSSVPAPADRGLSGQANSSLHSPSPSPPGIRVPCLSDTGSTCAIVGCKKSRGPGVSCVKSGGKDRCLCRAGFCAVNGVCVKTALER